MNLFELFVKIGVDDKASKNISKITSKLGSGLKTAAKVGTAAVTAAASAITALTAASVKNFAEYEQLVGGAELMFGKAFDTVMKNSQKAYQTVQMSQNEYLKQVNGFATGLKVALNNNEEAAADLAHKIIQAEADVIAATGNTQENVQNAFNGIMKSNFTMLDNLQIGITPTKEGFQEVIDKVNEWNATNGKATKYQMGNLADMQAALVDYIDMVGMSGYAQEEASKTIQGSLASMKAAWSDLLTSLGKENGDFSEQIENLVESASTFAKNVYPVVDRVFVALGEVVTTELPKIVKKVPSVLAKALPEVLKLGKELIYSLVEGISGSFDSIVQTLGILIDTVVNTVVDLLPQVLDLGVSLLTSLMDGISKNLDKIVPAVMSVIEKIITTITKLLPDLLKMGIQVLVSLAKGFAEAIPRLIPAVLDAVDEIVETLTDPETLDSLIDAAISLVLALADGLIEAIPRLLDAAVKLIVGLVEHLLTVDNLEKIAGAALDLVLELGAGLIKAIPELLGAAADLAASLVNKLLETDWIEVGRKIGEAVSWGLEHWRDKANEFLYDIKEGLGLDKPGISVEGFLVGMGESTSGLTEGEKYARALEIMGASEAEIRAAKFGGATSSSYYDREAAEAYLNKQFAFTDLTSHIDAYTQLSPKQSPNALLGVLPEQFATQSEVNIVVNGTDELARALADSMDVVQKERGYTR